MLTSLVAQAAANVFRTIIGLRRDDAAAERDGPSTCFDAIRMQLVLMMEVKESHEVDSFLPFGCFSAILTKR